MNVTTIGIDLAKSVFQVHGVDGSGKAVIRKRLRRKQVSPFFAQLPESLIGMEACSGARYCEGTTEAGPRCETYGTTVR